MTDIDRVLALDPCDSARKWMMSAHSGSAYDMWRRCDRGDWLLWLAARAGVDRRLVVLAACDCAETALVRVPAGEERPRIAIETARLWARGGATIAEARTAGFATAARGPSLAASARMVRARIPWSVVRDALRGEL